MAKINTRTTFEKILTDGAKKGMLPRMSNDSIKWFRDQAKKTKISDSGLIRENTDRLKNRAAIGEMVFFFYDPKHKATLPYYDSFPLIFKIEEYNDSFLGINLHYLPIPLRAKLMDALYDLTTNKKLNEKTRLEISYGILKSAAKYKYFKPCIKKYLKAHVRSRFLKVHSYEWDVAMTLPVESFVKKTKTKVWEESRGKI